MALSYSSTSVRNYDVFLSFRGEDTRGTIVSFLYEALCREGIFTFKDDRRLEVGDNISERLIQAINTSWFAVVVISENYATSIWCLEELRLITELHYENRIQVVPIFYGVEPSDVRRQTRSFDAAFIRYEEDLDTEQDRVLQWRKALNHVGSLVGLNSRTCLSEAAMVAEAVGRISSKLRTMKLTGLINLVGMEAHLLKMTLHLNMGSADRVLMIGIWGMGGIGKTTIAKCLYDRFSSQFPAHCFIEDIKKIYRDQSLSYLQGRFLFGLLNVHHIGLWSMEAGSSKIKARLGHRKVLVVLDGVDKVEQVHALAKETSWFGPESRIIITTRDRGLLHSCGVSNVYEVKCLDDEDALQVFKKSAFGGGSPPSDEFERLFIRASRLAHGLPSALVAYASYLSENRTIERWEDEISILETSPHRNVQQILRKSYDGLDDQDKIVFLHVACLLNGYPVNHATSLLDNGRPRINHLYEKSLITISTDGSINMHFLVVQTGRAIVRQESRDRPFRQRFLWNPNEIYSVLDNNIGTDEIEGVTLHMCEMPDTLPLSISVFSVMHSIRFLKFFQHLGGAESNVQLMSDGCYFPPNLRLLHWDAYPLKTLPSRFRHHHLVELNLRYSNLKSLWDKTVKLRNLRRLDVTGSKNLGELPDLSTATNFEELIIEGCMRLRKIPESLTRLENLSKLNAINCDIFKGVMFSVDFDNRLRHGGSWRTSLIFPNEAVQLDFLTDISIEGLMYIKLFDLQGSAESLCFCSKQQIPDQSMTVEQRTVTIQLMSDFDSPKSLEIKQFRYMENRPPFKCHRFSNLPILTELRLTNLNIQDIPEDICHLQFLHTVDLSGNDLEYLPTTMGQVPNLKNLSLSNCRKLKSLPQLAQVETLILSGCVKLISLLEHDSEENWGTYCLLELRLDNCMNVQRLSHQLYRFTKLTYLDLSRNDFVALPSSFIELSSLETLFLNNCKKLKSLEDLPHSVKYLYAHGCDSLQNVDVSPYHSIKHLDLIHCPRLNLEEYDHLKDLFLHDKHSQEGSHQCTCLPETEVSSDSDYEPSETSTTISQTGSVFEFFKSAFRF